MAPKTIQEWSLGGFQFASGFVKLKELGPIDLGKFADDAGAGRPFEVERVAVEVAGQVDIPLASPGVDDFPAFLADGSQGGKGALGLETDFLGEFALGGHEQIFPGANLPFGNAPMIFVLARGVRAPRMNKQHLQQIGSPAIHQKSRASS